MFNTGGDVKRVNYRFLSKILPWSQICPMMAGEKMVVLATRKLSGSENHAEAVKNIYYMGVGVVKTIS